MKLTRTILLFPIAALAMASCSDSATNVDPSGKAMTAKLNGSALNLTSVSSGWNTKAMFVTGSTDLFPPRQTIGIDLDSIGSTGTFQLGGINSVGSGEYRSASDSVYTTGVNATGTVTVTSFTDTHATGTFRFTAKRASNPNDSVVVSEGTFDVDIKI